MRLLVWAHACKHTFLYESEIQYPLKCLVAHCPNWTWINHRGQNHRTHSYYCLCIFVDLDNITHWCSLLFFSGTEKVVVWKRHLSREIISSGKYSNWCSEIHGMGSSYTNTIYKDADINGNVLHQRSIAHVVHNNAAFSDGSVRGSARYV